MPYIENKDRARLLQIVEQLNLVDINTEGELNYLVTKLCQAYLAKHGLRYQHLNAVVGALECAKLEFYRRVAAGYEDTKIVSNGDVYGPGEVK